MKLPDNKKSKLTNQSIYFPDLIDQVYSHLPTALFANILLSLILVVVLWSMVTHQILIIWISVLWAITVARFVQYFKYCYRKDASVGSWAYQFNIGLILTGIVWGSSGFLIFPGFSPPHQVFLAFVLGGLIAGATTSLSAMQFVLKIFVCLLIIPIVLRFLFIGGKVHLAMGGMLVIYGGMCIVMSSNIYTMLVTSILLQYKNKEEIEERKKAEASLKIAYEQLEVRVQERTSELQKALNEINTLRGILPICCYCKKIRDEKGMWNQLEAYIHSHSNAKFSHGACPECYKKQMEELDQ